MPSEKALRAAKQFLHMIDFYDSSGYIENLLADYFDVFGEDCKHLHDPVLEKLWDNPEDEAAFAV